MDDAAAVAAAKELVARGKAACVFVRDGVLVGQGMGSGVKPLLEMLDSSPHAMAGSWLVDRIIGRAAAAIAVIGGVKRVHAGVMSAGAADFLKAHGVPFTVDETVPVIINRAKTGQCPMEDAVRNLDDPSAMVAAVRSELKRL